MTSGSRITCTSDDAVLHPLEHEGRGRLVSVIRFASVHLFEVCAGNRPSAASAMLRAKRLTDGAPHGDGCPSRG